MFIDSLVWICITFVDALMMNLELPLDRLEDSGHDLRSHGADQVQSAEQRRPGGEMPSHADDHDDHDDQSTTILHFGYNRRCTLARAGGALTVVRDREKP